MTGAKYYSILLLSFILTINTFAEEVWRITSLEWPPYSSEHMPNQGNSIHMLRELLKQHDIKLAVDFLPWRRAQKRAKTPNYVGYFPSWPEEVAEGFVGSQAVDWSKLAVLKLKESTVDFKNFDELFQKYIVGVVETYVYPKSIVDAMKKHPQNVEWASEEVILLRKLAQKRNDVALTDPNVMKYLSQKHNITNIEAIKKNKTSKKLVIAFRDDAENRKRIEILKKILTKPSEKK